MASSEGGKLTVSSNIRTDYSSQTPKSYNPQHKSMSTLWIMYMFLLFFPPTCLNYHVRKSDQVIPNLPT